MKKEVNKEQALNLMLSGSLNEYIAYIKSLSA